MKKLLFALAIMLAICAPAIANGGYAGPDDPSLQERSEGVCPHTQMKISCLGCHESPTFKIKESSPTSHYSTPAGTKIIKDGNEIVAIHRIDQIESIFTENLFLYLLWHPEIKRVIFDIHSGGGSLVEAWKIVALMDMAKKRGLIIETQIQGFGASAAFLISCNGSKGYRYVGARAMLMHHELWTFKWLSVDTPSTKEDEAKTLRLWQDNINEWLAERCNLSVDDLNDMVHKKDFWMNGIKAKKHGFADKLL